MFSDIDRLWTEETEWWAKYNFGFGQTGIKKDEEIPSWVEEEREEEYERYFRT